VAAKLNWCMNQILASQSLDQTPDLGANQCHVPETGHALDLVADPGHGLDQTDVEADLTADHCQGGVDHENVQGQTASHIGVINKGQYHGLTQALEIMLLKNQDQPLDQDQDQDHNHDLMQRSLNQKHSLDYNHLLPKRKGHHGLILLKQRSLDQKHGLDHDHL